MDKVEPAVVLTNYIYKRNIGPLELRVTYTDNYVEIYDARTTRRVSFGHENFAELGEWLTSIAEQRRL